MKRTEAQIMESILDAYCGLSPENLSCDGEASGAYMRKRSAELRAQLRRDFAELGRVVSEAEAFGFPRSEG